MKSFDDLNDSDKKKFNTFLISRMISLSDYNFMVLLAFLIAGGVYITGLFIMVISMQFMNSGVTYGLGYGMNSTTTVKMLDVSYRFMQTSILIVLFGMIAFLVVYAVGRYLFEKNKKADYLAFGYTDFKDALEIKKSDIDDLKRTYKKVKK
jgi:hypothetical protein